MIKPLFLYIIVLLNVAFYTLLERKFLRYIQVRKGPTIVGPLGLLQPFRDGLKLVTKESTFRFIKEFFMKLRPVLFFFFSLFLWIPILSSCGIFLDCSFLFILGVRRVIALLVFFRGWRSGRSFSFIGGVRASAQIISYEVILAFIILCPLLLYQHFSFFIILCPLLLLNFWACFILCPLLLITILAETNRAPFDLTEGESELVSGFNTEYSSVYFVFLFLGEYSSILFFSFFGSLLIFNSWKLWWIFGFLILWIRACFPRKRYDILMNLIWIFLFPLLCTDRKSVV